MTKQIFTVTVLSVLGALIWFSPAVINEREINAQSQSYPVIKPSEVIRDLLEKKKQNSKISAKELADYGNELIKNKGYDFSFYACDIAEANKQIPAEELYNDSYKAYKYQLKDIGGKTTTYQIMNKFYEIPCGCGFEIPIFQISDQAMTVKTDGGQVKLMRPEKFGLDEVELVDKSLKKTLRKWYMPSDNIPFGISKDGTKIYIDTGYDDYLINELVLEISENGTVRVVPRNDPNILSRGKELKGYPKIGSEISYMSFNFGNKSHIVKFSYPCT
jgi:hypothetical protein